MTEKEFEETFKRNAKHLPLHFMHLHKVVKNHKEMKDMSITVDEFSVYNSAMSACNSNYKPTSTLLYKKNKNAKKSI